MPRAPFRTPYTRLPAAPVLDWLDTDQHGASVLATARAMLDAQAHIRRALPPGLGPACSVVRIEGQRMTVGVPGAAYASKLRQMAPRLVRTLNDAGWNLNEIIVRVQGGLRDTVTNPSPRQIEPLGPLALQAFDSLQAQLDPGPLAEAIQRLLHRHGHAAPAQDP